MSRQSASNGSAGPEAKALAERARDYFGQSVFSRLLEAVWKRYEGLGRVGGKAVIPALEAEECDAINGFMSMNLRPGDKVELPLARFERELLDSVFKCDIALLHAWLKGGPLVSRTDSELLLRQQWLDFMAKAERQLQEAKPTPLTLSWLALLRQGQGAGCRTLRELWGGDQEEAAAALTVAALAWNTLQESRARRAAAVRLPVLAARLSGDPHALDRNRPAGRLLFQALLAYRQESARWTERRGELAGEAFLSAEETISEAVPELSADEAGQGLDSLQARACYRSWGVLDDDISSYVQVYFPGRRCMETAQIWSLAQVEFMAGPPESTSLYVVENPAVFSTLIDAAQLYLNSNESLANTGAALPGLLCTSGPASAAALRLMDLYLSTDKLTGCIWYSGDYDLKGIAIGNVIARRYRTRFLPWRFDAEAYSAAMKELRLAGVRFDERERKQLAALNVEWQSGLGAALLLEGRKLFQEELMNVLLEDWLHALGCREKGL